jgi:serine/threonine-protein kinase
MTLDARVLAASIALAARDLTTAQAEAETDLFLAESCGYVLTRIDLLLWSARIALAIPDRVLALSHAQTALTLSKTPGCGYAWGEAEALHLIGLAHAGLGDAASARAPLERALALRQDLGGSGIAELSEMIGGL